MYTCHNCTYALAITKITTDIQENAKVITDPNEFIKLYVNKKKKQSDKNAQIDIYMELNFELNSLKQQIQKNNINKDVEQLLIDKYNNIKKNMKPNTFCLKCTKCNEKYELPSGIISSTKIKKVSNVEAVENPEEIITDMTLFRTKDFICPNKECNKKVKLEDKEAVYYRPNPDENVTKLICVNCYLVF